MNCNAFGKYFIYNFKLGKKSFIRPGILQIGLANTFDT